MSDLSGLGRALALAGVLLALAGILIFFLGKASGTNSGHQISGALQWLGRLPGDVAIERDGYSFYAPFTTCLILSLLISLIVYIVSSFWKP